MPSYLLRIGSGTGLFTRALLAHPDWANSVKELRAIEPSAGMREVFANATTDPRVSVHAGTFDSVGVEDGWADLIVIAQVCLFAISSRYLAGGVRANAGPGRPSTGAPITTRRPSSLRGCSSPAESSPSSGTSRTGEPPPLTPFALPNLSLQSLSPRADRDRATWVAQNRDIYEVFESGSPQFRLGLWRATWSTPGYQANFEPAEENVWSYVLPGTRDIVIDRACSKSYIAILEPEARQKVIDDLDEVLKRKENFTWIDEEKGIFEYPYQTFLYIARKK